MRLSSCAWGVVLALAAACTPPQSHMHAGVTVADAETSGNDVSQIAADVSEPKADAAKAPDAPKASDAAKAPDAAKVPDALETLDVWLASDEVQAPDNAQAPDEAQPTDDVQAADGSTGALPDVPQPPAVPVYADATPSSLFAAEPPFAGVWEAPAPRTPTTCRARPARAPIRCGS